VMTMTIQVAALRTKATVRLRIYAASPCLRRRRSTRPSAIAFITYLDTALQRNARSGPEIASAISRYELPCLYKDSMRATDRSLSFVDAQSNEQNEVVGRAP
jgi:hypothetical protein